METIKRKCLIFPNNSTFIHDDGRNILTLNFGPNNDISPNYNAGECKMVKAIGTLVKSDENLVDANIPCEACGCQIGVSIINVESLE